MTDDGLMLEVEAADTEDWDGPGAAASGATAR